MGSRRKVNKNARREAIEGYLFVLPLLIGLLFFTVWPVIQSLIISFCKYNIVTPAKFIGAKNYVELFHDQLFWKSLLVTTIYSVISVPLGLAAGLGVALLMNSKVKGIAIFRTIYYLPAVVSGVAVSLLWVWIFNPDYGLANVATKALHLGTYKWLNDPRTALGSLILMSLWGVGGGMVIYLAGLQGVPQHLYEAANLDGANSWQQFTNVTIPMLTPVIFYNLIMGIIGSFQVFTQAFVMTGGGPNNSTLFYVLYLFRQAFNYFHMGYASAMAWVLFAIILVLTLLVFKSSSAWVYYEGDRRG
jgi:multiple sugar transport system permease protein